MSPDGDGPTLEIIDALGDPGNPANWRASLYVNGSPGASGVPGDYDGNGIIKDADHSVWRSKFGMTVGVGTSGDGNRDGIVDLADYIIWRKAMTAPGSSTVVAASDAADEVGNGSLVVSSASPVRAQLEPLQESRPHILAVDHVFTRFDATRPAFRPVLARTLATDAGDDDLLLASLASRAARGAVAGTQVAADERPDKDQPIDRLLADWAGVEDALDLD
jgi:hypothetical protein